MIITVTLNTAIDKTLSVPNFRLGRRHRTVEQTTMPGGKGVNVARVLKALGQPVIATGLHRRGDRHADRRPAHPALRAVSDFVRIREESRTNTAVIDPTTGEQTEINERGPKVSEQEVELFVDKLLYLAKGASVCVFAGSLPRDVDTDIYAKLIRELRRLGVADDRRHRRRPAAARGPRRARRDLPERARGRGARRPRVQRRRRRLGDRRARDVRARRARGDHDDARRLLRAHALDEHGVEPALYRVRLASPALEPRATVGSGDAFLAGFVAARYTRPRRPPTCLAYGVACGAESTQHLGAGLIDPDRVERLLAETEVERPSAAGQRSPAAPESHVNGGWVGWRGSHPQRPLPAASGGVTRSQARVIHRSMETGWLGYPHLPAQSR